MKKARREIWLFVIGLIMLVAGLFIFSQKVLVSSSLIGGGIRLGNFNVASGLIVVPLIIGVMWMFISDGHIASKIFSGFSALLIVVAIIMTTRLTLTSMPLFDWILILVLIFGGLALVLRTLLGGKIPDKDEVREDEAQAQIKKLERELEELKKKTDK